MPPKKGPKLPKIPIIVPEVLTPSVPNNLDKHTTITINDQKFEIEADDLEVICELGKSIYVVSSAERWLHLGPVPQLTPAQAAGPTGWWRR